MVIIASMGALALSVANGATELTSDPIPLFIRTETSSFWNTATNNSLTIPIPYPEGASSATLEVTGSRRSWTCENITAKEFVLELPAAESPETEDVYGLTLTFDDGSSRTARFGLIQGVRPDASGLTRCLVPQGNRAWNKVKGWAVLPIPYGMSSFTINGVETDTGLGGAQGWYPIGEIGIGEPLSLTLTTDAAAYAASLLGGGSGMAVTIR